MRLNFNPRAPRGARPGGEASHVLTENISIHVPREGHDQRIQWRRPPPNLFQSTCPARGTTTDTMAEAAAELISIHVPREGHDPSQAERSMRRCDFNPRAPRGARRQGGAPHRAAPPYFNPRAPRGARRRTTRRTTAAAAISIHVPREGHDKSSTGQISGKIYFNPRAPRGARHRRQADKPACARHFNPRAPRGARPPCRSQARRECHFNPRAPRGARLVSTQHLYSPILISIHVPREGHDMVHPGAARP